MNYQNPPNTIEKIVQLVFVSQFSSIVFSIMNEEIYVINNEIHFNSDINSKTAYKLIEKLLNLQDKIIKLSKKINKELEEKNEENSSFFSIQYKPILLYITTNGGSLHQSFSIIDTIENMKVPVHTICKGNVMSGGSLISLAGKRRYMTKHSFMLIHELRTNTGYSKYSTIQEELSNSSLLMKTIIDYYVRKSKMTIEEVEEQLKKDVYWDSATCLEKGLIDEII